jgi:hypothetical protein
MLLYLLIKKYYNKYYIKVKKNRCRILIFLLNFFLN